MGIFWIVFAGFFMYVFPLAFGGIPSRSSPVMATIALGVGLILWLALTLIIYRTLVHKPAQALKEARLLQREGVLRQAKILEQDLMDMTDEGDVLDLLLSFENLRGARVEMTYSLIDSRPDEARFAVGKTIDLRLNEADRGIPLMVGEGEIVRALPPRYGMMLAIFNIAYMVVSFLVWYKLQSNGAGWRFLGIGHPWVMGPGIGLFIFLLMTGGLGFLMGKGGADDQMLLTKGKRTEGKVVLVKETGLLLNDQPEVLFKVRYTTAEGVTKLAEIKKIIPLTQLHTLQPGPADILYLPEDPDRVAFLADWKGR